MLEIIQFENGRYGLRHPITHFIVDREWRTRQGARRAAAIRVRRSKRMRDRIFARQLQLRAKVKD